MSIIHEIEKRRLEAKYEKIVFGLQDDLLFLKKDEQKGN